MPEPEFTINKNGTIVIRSGGISIAGIIPHIQEAPILPFLITHNETGVRFDTESGRISMSVLKDRDEMILSTEIEGFENVHDIEPIGTAVLSGAGAVYV